jgi:hypothetical protein
MPYQVMAAAMAKRGQIKLFGDTPTIAEATLARARKRVFYDERYAAAFPEHKLYLCSFCKGYKQRRSAGRKLVPWPTTKNGSRHGHMTPPRKLYSSIMN